MLGRVRVGGPDCCAARATAAARWRPAEPWGRVARGGELQREGKRAVKGWGATRGCHGEQEVAGAGPERWAAALSAGGAEAEKQGGRR